MTRVYLGGIIKLYKMKLQSSNKVESAPRLLNRQMRHALRMVTVLETPSQKMARKEMKWKEFYRLAHHPHPLEFELYYNS